jgi:CheY-like chemotaxis protein
MPKVLLLEDDRDMVTLLRTFLELEGYTVSAMKLGEPVLPLLERENPDVVLLDVFLAGQNGLQIMESIRTDPRLRSTRVVMVSGMDVSAECMKKGADAFLLKPYMPDDLVRLLKQTAEGTPPAA